MIVARKGWSHHLRLSGPSCGMHAVQTGRTDATAVRDIALEFRRRRRNRQDLADSTILGHLVLGIWTYRKG